MSRLNVLSSAAIAYQKRARNILDLEKIQRELERKLDAAQKTYEALLIRLQAIQVAENQNIGNTRVVAQATPSKKPLDAKRKLILGAAAFAGLMFAIAGTNLLLGGVIIHSLLQQVRSIRDRRQSDRHLIKA